MHNCHVTGKPRFGQYCEAFPHHAAELDAEADPELVGRWIEMLPDEHRDEAAVAVTGLETRGEVLGRLYELLR